MDLRIRKATRRDATAVVELVKQLAELEGKPSHFSKKHFIQAGFGRVRHFSTIVAVSNKFVIGYAAFHEGYDLESATKGLYLIDLFVRKDYRGQRVGSSLMKTLAKKCNSNGCQWIAWNVSKDNDDAIRFYESMKAQMNNSIQYWIDV